MGLIDAGASAKFDRDRYLGDYEPHYESHDALNMDKAAPEEARTVARSVERAVAALRAGRPSQPDKQIRWPHST